MADNPQGLGEYTAILRRRKIHFAVPAGIVFMIAAVLAFTLPPIYQSTATILIERQQIPTDMVASAVTGNAVEQIHTISQQVMTFDNLWKIVEDFDLYPGERSPENAYQIVGRMHESISMEMVSENIADPRTGKATEVTIAFAVSFTSEIPAVAKRVAGRLAELYLDENRKSRTYRAAETSTFLGDEAGRLNAQIVDLELQIAKFKREHPDLLPEFAGVNREFLTRAEQQRKEVAASISELTSRRTLLLAQMGEVQGGYEERLRSLRAELATAREKYSSIHPDVVRLKRALAQLEAEKKSGKKIESLSTLDTQNRELYLSLQSDLETVTSNLSSNRLRLNELDNDIAEYQGRLKMGPEVEREYLALNRDYDNAVEKYREIKDKQMQAQLSEELERAQKGEHLSLLQAPRLPSTPIKPNRLGILLLGIMLAMVSGIGFAAIAEFRDHTIHGIRELTAIMKTQPIGIIPVIDGGVGYEK